MTIAAVRVERDDAWRAGLIVAKERDDLRERLDRALRAVTGSRAELDGEAKHLGVEP